MEKINLLISREQSLEGLLESLGEAAGSLVLLNIGWLVTVSRYQGPGHDGYLGPLIVMALT